MLLIADFAAWRSPQIQVHSEFDYHNRRHHEPIATVLSPSRADPSNFAPLSGSTTIVEPIPPLGPPVPLKRSEYLYFRAMAPGKGNRRIQLLRAARAVRIANIKKKKEESEEEFSVESLPTCLLARFGDESEEGAWFEGQLSEEAYSEDSEEEEYELTDNKDPADGNQ
jgi:hypothetical protein